MSSSHSQFPGAQQSQDFFGLGFEPLSDPLAYPYLNATKLEEVAPFGERCTIAENDPLVSAGDYPFNSYVILSGTVRAVDISTGERVVFVRYGAGNWQINIYADAKLSFTGEGAAGDRTPEAGLHPQTDARSWQTTIEFLREVFKQRSLSHC